MLRRLVLLVIIVNFCEIIGANSSQSVRSKRQLSNEINVGCGVSRKPLLKVNDRIANGEFISQESFPWIVAIMKTKADNDFFYICTGTLVSPSKVVTAAHCIEDKKSQNITLKADDLVLLFGAFNISADEPDRVQAVPSAIIVHQDWDSLEQRFTNDIALLILKDDIQYSDNIRPICLIEEEFPTGMGTVVGWGTSGKGTKPNEDIARFLDIPIIPNADCYRENHLLAMIAWNKSFCAGRKGVGVCLGDSGGGFFVEHNNRFYFKGFVSSSIYSLSGCYTENYAVYTNVVKYSEFIGIHPQTTTTASTPKTTTTTTKRTTRTTTKRTRRTRTTPSSITPVVAATMNLVTSTTTTAPTTTEDFSEALPSLDSTCGVMFSESSLIVGGKFSTRKQFPWFVSINLKAENGEFTHKSSGTLVSVRYVVSTAHAVAEADSDDIYQPVSIDSVRLCIGADTFKISEASGVERVKEILIFPDAKTGEPNVFDIALIKMQKEVQLSSVVFPVCLKKFRASNHVDQTAYAVGSSSVQDGIRKKKHVAVKIENEEKCRSFYNDYINYRKESRYFCATGSKQNTPLAYDAPLYMKLDDKWHLIGMLNMRMTPEKPILYENIYKFVKWIEEEIEK